MKKVGASPWPDTCDDGVTVTTAKDGQEALDTLQAGKGVDPILTDVAMPQACNFPLQLAPQIPVLALFMSLSALLSFAIISVQVSGIQLTSAIGQTPDLQHLPVVGTLTHHV